METHHSHPGGHEHGHEHEHEHPHHRMPIDESYRLNVHMILWVIAGAVLLAFCAWWLMT